MINQLFNPDGAWYTQKAKELDSQMAEMVALNIDLRVGIKATYQTKISPMKDFLIGFNIALVLAELKIRPRIIFDSIFYLKDHLSLYPKII